MCYLSILVRVNLLSSSFAIVFSTSRRNAASHCASEGSSASTSTATVLIFTWFSKCSCWYVLSPSPLIPFLQRCANDVQRKYIRDNPALVARKEPEPAEDVSVDDDDDDGSRPRSAKRARLQPHFWAEWSGWMKEKYQDWGEDFRNTGWARYAIDRLVLRTI